ncbi:MAG: type II toxin-antitoxin system HicA family toxin [Acidimicrobiales bacterium]
MSDKLPSIKPRQLIRALEQVGWQLDRTRGSHYILTHSVLHKSVPIPLHNRDLKAGTLAAILRSTGLTRDQLRELL